MSKWLKVLLWARFERKVGICLYQNFKIWSRCSSILVSVARLTEECGVGLQLNMI